jgi:hypothetical protein
MHLNKYIPNTRASNEMKQKWTELNEEKIKSVIIVGNFINYLIL